MKKKVSFEKPKKHHGLQRWSFLDIELYFILCLLWKKNWIKFIQGNEYSDNLYFTQIVARRFSDWSPLEKISE